MKKWLLLLCLTLTPSTWAALPAGTQAPNIFGRTLDGQLFRLGATHGKTRLINFFWVQCIPCREELPELAHLEAEFPNTQIIAVHAEEGDRAVVQKFVDGLKGVPSTVVLGSRMIMDRYGIKGFPHTIILDKEGKVIQAFNFFNEQTMPRIRQVLSQQ